ncbi:hypothetical protein K6119_15940 [Paracrocinitomix mangrovi]|uniref:hypothetical protein n=1 Tax=Paracrocinitomix mangrovi TaxID=2862509 RepID=UPI001C8D9AFA|nr:hypothetical protein [Paracrocinitomix mangrovi]UKN01221.1 hypothetical protein K6119_15940 [Paracrocinitomix mangrovi]
MNNHECLLITDALAMNSKMPMKQIHSCIVCTPNYFFIVPTKTVGVFVIFDTIKNHSFFEGQTIPQGLKTLINNTEKLSDLENQMKEILNQDAKYIFDLSEATSKKIKGFLGKKTLQIREGKSWVSFSPKSKAEGKALAEFYPNF